MTIMHFSSTISGGDQYFAPTVYGRISSAGILVLGQGEDYELDPGTSSCHGRAGIWLWRTGGDIYIRCGCWGDGNVIAQEIWYNGGGIDQGDPGRENTAGTDIMQLNSDVDSVNIYAAANDFVAAGSPTDPTFSAYGTFTDDDKSTFFLPTVDTKYGRLITSDGSGGSGVREGTITVQYTFRKANYADLTITFRGEGIGNWETDVP